MTRFIDDHKQRFGVEPICRVLTGHGVRIAPSTYYATKTRAPSARKVRDAELVDHIERIFADRTKGRGISGARKIWRLLLRDDIQVARCTVERLMRQQGLRGIRRGKQFVTTRPDTTASRPRTSSIVISSRRHPTAYGSSISPMCRPGRGWHSPRS